MKIATNYPWVMALPQLPPLVKGACKLDNMNMKEIKGPQSNQNIMALAKYAGVADTYKNDDTPWCALAMSGLLGMMGQSNPIGKDGRLWAKSFLNYGAPVTEPMFGDVLVFRRAGSGGHVGVYIAEDSSTYHVAGGNQSNDFNVTRVSKSRLLGARRPPYSGGLPACVRKYMVNGTVKVSKNEA